RVAKLEPPKNIEATSVSPDIGESRNAEQIDDAIPTRAYDELPVVGLGGSAGSLAPLQQFFSQMPADSGLVFVVVLHLSPDFESSMAEILQRSTKMPVTQVRDKIKVEPNHIYVIPPAKHLLMTDGHLSLADIERERGKRVTVDLFFRTLADTHGPNAIAIVLSGADSDGAIGIKRIKERGGLTIAQDPQESEHASMPRSAITTGMIDWILRAAEMPSRLIEFRQNGIRLQIPQLVEQTLIVSDEKLGDEVALRDVLSVLRTHTGRDFTGYKRGTILRRIARRMQVNGIGSLHAYHAFLRTHPGETGALLQDLLISVTNFFRDRETFESLWAALPELFKGKGPSDTFRVWVPGCATGEEAYSLAILLIEYAGQLEAPPQLQVFATDIDENAIAVGRIAQYPETIVADVSEERLRRFFVKHKEHYRLSQSVREIVLFAVHDLLRDAPFSRLDLVSCRNLLIYFNRESQNRVFEIFHFSLRPEGCLFLGTSETADEAGGLFFATHKKHRLHRRLPAKRMGLPLFAGPLSLTLALQAKHRTTEKIVLPLVTRRPPDVPGSHAMTAEAHGTTASELHLKLAERFAPPSLVVDHDNQIVHVSPGAGRFLQIGSGELARNVLRLVHPVLRVELRAALFRASETTDPVDVFSVPVEFESGGRRLVDISIRTAPELAPGFLLVVFYERDAAHAPASAFEQHATEPEGVVRSLERELEIVKQNLNSSREEHGATTEEMKASNEELHAMNEELRSASEELETSREELQSINEELVTVNHDLKTKVDELARSNSDTQNLMAATNVATVFLDSELRIKRYTPSAIALFHFIASDLGRPLLDLRHRLEFDTVIGDAEEVLKKFRPIERDMRAADGRRFLARTIPYRTAEDRVEGVVLTFVDVTQLKVAEDAVRESE
ncbi:MAG: chemotaxis protein CheB, partial [Verrucomicrobiota bacterium]